jgi:hypothetical protein
MEAVATLDPCDRSRGRGFEALLCSLPRDRRQVAAAVPDHELDVVLAVAAGESLAFLDYEDRGDVNSVGEVADVDPPGWS